MTARLATGQSRLGGPVRSSLAREAPALEPVGVVERRRWRGPRAERMAHEFDDVIVIWNEEGSR